MLYVSRAWFRPNVGEFYKSLIVADSLISSAYRSRVRTVSEPKRAPQNAGKEALSRKRMARRYE